MLRRHAAGAPSLHAASCHTVDIQAERSRAEEQWNNRLIEMEERHRRLEELHPCHRAVHCAKTSLARDWTCLPVIQRAAPPAAGPLLKLC